MKELLIKCTCGHEFAPAKRMIIEHKYPSGLIELYYLCPRCRVKHHVCYMDSETKKIQKLIDKARSAGDTDTCKALCEKKKMLMDKLNNRL